MPQRPDVGTWNSRINLYGAELFGLLDRYFRGIIGEDDLYLGMDAILQEGHADSWRLGRQLGGDFSHVQGLDSLMGRIQADNDSYFLRGFVQDLEDRVARYWDSDGPKRNMIGGRAKLYLGRMRGTANHAFMQASDPEVLFNWELRAEDHCGDCPQLAALSPYTRDANLGYPGDGSQQCRGNCKCILIRADGVTGFGRADYLGGPE